MGGSGELGSGVGCVGEGDASREAHEGALQHFFAGQEKKGNKQICLTPETRDPEEPDASDLRAIAAGSALHDMLIPRKVIKLKRQRLKPKLYI